MFGVASDTNCFSLLIPFLELNYKSFYQFVTQKLRMPSMDQQRQDLRDALAVFDTSDTGQSNAFYSKHRINNSRIPVQANTYKKEKDIWHNHEVFVFINFYPESLA